MYYPKSKIQENQYTNGKQFAIKSTNEEYIGYYYTLFNGDSYTGKNPTSDLTPQLLIDYNESLKIQKTPKDIIFYDSIKSAKLPDLNAFSPIISQIIVPSETDYLNADFARYFAQKKNGGNIIEINKSIFDSLQKNESKYDYISYNSVEITWAISGNLEDVIENNIKELGVKTINKNAIAVAEKTIKGISQYLNDVTEFYRF
jgi:hypothetical protein